MKLVTVFFARKSNFKKFLTVWEKSAREVMPNVEIIISRTIVLDGQLSRDNLGIDVGIGGTSNENIISGITGLLMHVTFNISLFRRVEFFEYKKNWCSRIYFNKS